MVAAGSGVEPGGHSNSFQVSGIFNIYSIYIQLSSFWYIQYIFNIYSTFKLQGYWLHIPYKFSTYSIHIQCTVFDSANGHKGSDVDLEDYDK